VNKALHYKAMKQQDEEQIKPN